MPVDGQLGTASDGTPVVWSAKLGRAVPINQAKPLGITVGGAAAPRKPSEDERKRVAGMQGGFDEAEKLNDLSSDFMSRNAHTPTGGLLAVPGFEGVAKALPWSSPDLSTMDRDAAQMATALRSPNMRLTQQEFNVFRGAGPSTHSTFDQNKQNAAEAQKAMPIAAARASYYSTYLDKRGTLAGADDGWLRFKAQHFAPDGTFLGANPGPAPDPRAAANAALRRQSGLPVMLGIEGE